MGIGLRSRSGRHWLLPIAAGVGLLAAAGGVGAYALADTQRDTGPAKPGTAQVSRGTVSKAVAASGTVQPAQTRGLAFSLAGTVSVVKVRPGDKVNAGQVLAAIDDEDARDAVSRAEDALAAANKSLDTAKTQADKAAASATTCGVAYVEAAPTASPTATPRPTPTTTARPTPRPTATAAPRCTSTRSSGGDQIFRAQEQVNNAELQLEQAQAQLDGATITAPIGGKVLSVAGTVGARVSAGGSFIELGGVDEMQVRASFPEADAVRVAIGQQATVTLADRSEPLAATVTQVDPMGTADGQLVTFGVRLAFKSAPADLLVGQSADVRVQIGAVADALSVPVAAVHDLSGKTGTVTVVAGGRQERRQVGVGLVGDDSVQITSGVAAGETVLTS